MIGVGAANRAAKTPSDVVIDVRPDADRIYVVFGG